VEADFDIFPLGGAHGLPVLKLRCGGDPFQLELARRRMDALDNAPGAWGIWLDGVADWDSQEVRQFLLDQDQAGRGAVAIRELSDRVWPMAGCEFVLEGSAALRNVTTPKELVAALANFPQQSAIQDLIVRLEPDQLPPPSSVLDMLAEWVSAADLNYLYLPAGYEFRPNLLRSICRCGSRWAIR
jgi:hypothetical protein